MGEVTCVARYNVDINSKHDSELHSRFDVRSFQWGDAESLAALKPPYDVIVASDVLFFDEALSKLAESLVHLSKPGTKILIAGPDCLPNRRGMTQRLFYPRLEASGITVTDVLAD